MRDFSNFKPENNNGSANSYGDLIKNLASKYVGASENELISAIIVEAEKGRRNGTLSDSDIDNFALSLSPMLNASQKKKLSLVIEKIKKIK